MIAGAAMEDQRQVRDSGVQCPKCGCAFCPVVYTRHYGQRTIRKRKCGRCSNEFRSEERAVTQ